MAVLDGGRLSKPADRGFKESTTELAYWERPAEQQLKGRAARRRSEPELVPAPVLPPELPPAWVLDEDLLAAVGLQLPTPEDETRLLDAEFEQVLSV